MTPEILSHIKAGRGIRSDSACAMHFPVRQQLLKRDPRRHLPGARNVVPDLVEDASRHAGAIHAAVRLAQIRVIRKVKAFGAELQLRFLREGEVFEEGQVELREPRSPKGVTA